jgi:DNA-binding CsgD family transcriptional regulator
MSMELPNDQLARVISEAAFNPARWSDVCDEMARFASADGALIIPADVAQRSLPTSETQKSLGLPHSTRIDDLISVYQSEGWYKNDLRERGLPSMLRRGYMIDADCIAYDDIKRSNYYQDLLKPAGVLWFVGIGIQSAKNVWCLSILRHLQTEPFSESEILRLLTYRDMLAHSAGIARQLGFARAHGVASVLEQHGLCAVALDATGRIAYVSPSAECHLADSLLIKSGKLHARRGSEDIALSKLISAVCGKIIIGWNPQVALSRADNRPPLVLYGCRLPANECDVFQPAVALLVISDPERQQHIPPDLLMDYFGLTRSEARLAIALHLGASVEQHAADQAISPVTARNHLQGLLRKTSTHRKSDLIAVLNKVIPRK